jgi:hypothetical protein
MLRPRLDTDHEWSIPFTGGDAWVQVTTSRFAGWLSIEVLLKKIAAVPEPERQAILGSTDPVTLLWFGVTIPWGYR